MRFNRQRTGILVIGPFLFFLYFSSEIFAKQTQQRSHPPGAPGIPHLWAPALKQAVGTAYEEAERRSPVWFTVAEGIVTEVFYPSVDQAQVGDLQLLVTDGHRFFAEQKRDVLSQVRFSNDGASVSLFGEERRGYFRLEQEVVTDPRLPVLRIKTVFKPQKPGLRLVVLFKPAIHNRGMKNQVYFRSEGMLATAENGSPNRAPVFAALLSSVPWFAGSAGYVGFSDGWQDLSKNFRLTEFWGEAGPGNVAVAGELLVPLQGDFSFDLALSFASQSAQAFSNARVSLETPFAEVKAEFNQGWKRYLQQLETSEVAPKKFLKESEFARRSALVIKMHEDKGRRGAIVASLSKPAIPSGTRAEDEGGGYHLVWPRDLYHAALGLLAAGDRRTPVDALHYLVSTQLENGSWFQNFWVDGTPYWQGLQMDEVALPILLAHQLAKKGAHALCPRDLEMVRRAALFISAYGPKTPQDRWEEIGGYIPSTLAAEIASLRAAASLTGVSHFDGLARRWTERLESWTVVSDGPHGKNYYLRVSPSGKPNEMEWIELANGAGGAMAFEILDGGFLDLARFQVKSAGDATILNTLQMLESSRLGMTASFPKAIPDGLIFRRYNRDAYGPGGEGGFWPLLAGERGHFALMQGDSARARAQLFMMEAVALESGVLAEQVHSAFPLRTGLGVASPLVWAHAEDLRLHRSIEEGHVFDTP